VSDEDRRELIRLIQRKVAEAVKAAAREQAAREEAKP
jgi:hypothetical protein